MKNIINGLGFIIFALLLPCCTMQKSDKNASTDENQEAVPAFEKPTKADSILKETIEAHGGNLYEDASYSFTFRKKRYTFTNRKNGYTYSVHHTNNGKEIHDVLENGTLVREVNGIKTELSQKENKKYSSSLNSVIYFATLPHKLADKSVKTVYKGTAQIKGQPYDVLEITFDKEGGGQDHDDEFHYWINAETKTIDYLAYNYQVNGGGVRFRSAYNPRTIDGIRFQDYVNYKADIGTPLIELPALYEAGELKELSRIKTEEVVNLNGK